jgi:hypothetical protein
MKKKNIVRIAILTGIILLIPLVAMQFDSGVDWSLFDFAVAGALLFGSGLAYELIAGRGGNAAYRAAVAVTLGAALLLVWINLAVGIIGSEENPVNLLYFWALFVGLIGATAARLQPRGMSWAMFATAFVVACVPVAAMIINKPYFRSLCEAPGVLGVLTLNAFFVMLFVVAGLMFRHSATGQSGKGAL